MNELVKAYEQQRAHLDEAIKMRDGYRRLLDKCEAEYHRLRKVLEEIAKDNWCAHPQEIARAALKETPRE